MTTTDIKQQVTDTVIAALENVTGRFQMPFLQGATGLSKNIASGKHYRGVNVLLLGLAGYASPVWGTYKQWQAKGAQVKRGEKATGIVFWKRLDGEDKDGEEYSYMMARGYKVFNSQQVDGWDFEVPTTQPDATETVTRMDEFFANLKIRTETGSGRAFYSPSQDFVSLPPDADFLATDTSTATENKYSTVAHEYTHATGHETRLDRDFSQGRFGDPDYAAEELVAELGAAMILSYQGLTSEVRDDHVKYVKGWLKALKNDKNFIFTAASKSQAALDWMIEQQPVTEAIKEAA